MRKKIAKVKLYTTGGDIWWDKRFAKDEEEILEKLIHYLKRVLEDMRAGIDVSK